MPELPEVEAVCRKLRRDALNATIDSAEFYRANTVAPAKARTVAGRIAGATIDRIGRRGKNILLHLSKPGAAARPCVLRVHLRMTGNLYVAASTRLRLASVRASFAFTDGRAMVFDDPRALGRISLHTPAEAAALADEIGVEPLDAEFTAERFKGLAAGCRRPVKLFLMDQRYVAGLGNIYAAESLFQAGIHPARAVQRISSKRLKVLHHSIVSVLRDALNSACQAYERPGHFAEGENFPMSVYGREGESCLRCGATVRRIPQGGRSTYYCPGCQR